MRRRTSVELLLVHLADVPSVEEDLAGVDRDEADEHLEHDALAAPGGAHHRDGLAAADLEVKVGVDDLRSEGLAHARRRR